MNGITTTKDAGYTFTYNTAEGMNSTTTMSNVNQKKIIGVFWSNRSEIGLLRPVMEELKKVGFEVQEYRVPDNPYEVLDYMQSLDIPVPDYAMVPYDRPPMTMVGFLCYHNHIPIIQLHAGDISSGSYDDLDRWVLSLWADYHFCAGPAQAKRLRKFLRAMGKEPSHVYVSGTTNLDDINNMEEPPDGDYDVVVYNVPTRNNDRMAEEIQVIFNMLDKETYWIEPQGDQAEDKFVRSIVKDFAKVKSIHLVPTMPHESFLGLLSRAKRMIGNSSAMFFEAPYFKVEVVQVGVRNAVRESVKLKPGGGRRIAKRLKQWLTTS